jgi:uncharacterized protein
MKQIVGRKHEVEVLDRLMRSPKSEFLALYGRRRIGKTFLIREYFDYTFEFEISGLANGTSEQQLAHFHNTFDDFSRDRYAHPPKNWLEAFDRLKKHLSKIKTGKKKKIIFLDEMPWMDTLKSDFIMALESFWNSWATNRKDILLLASGSSSSWMLNKLINNKGGLHNRITMPIKLNPLTLKEVEEFLKIKGCQLDRYQIAELYMALGGIPYYFDFVQPGMSVAQIIDSLFFSQHAKLNNEFANLYKSLFKKYTWHEKIVETLSLKTKGFTRKEIVELSGLASGGTMTKTLKELEQCYFISTHKDFDENTKNLRYRLSDFYTAFYFKFIKNTKYTGKSTWTKLVDNPVHRAWQGYTFEQLCMSHVGQLKNALGIPGILSNDFSWHNDKTQIDLVIDRRDHVINIFEMKFSLSRFAITKDYHEKLRNKIAHFKEGTKTRKSVFLTFVTTYGLEKNKYYGIVQNDIKLDSLFV